MPLSFECAEFVSFASSRGEESADAGVDASPPPPPSRGVFELLLLLMLRRPRFVKRGDAVSEDDDDVNNDDDDDGCQLTNGMPSQRPPWDDVECSFPI